MKKIVIIGGGFAGAYAARKLERDFDVTLIDTKNYFEFTPGILRTIVEPSHIKKIQALHTNYLHRSRVIHDHVVEVRDREVVTEKSYFRFDYLIIGSGSGYNSPFKEREVIISTRAINLRNEYTNLCAAKKILIIGGGLVGVEIASEIATNYSDKDITIIHAMGRLMERQPEKASKYAERFLKKKGVKILYNEFVSSDKNGFFIREGRLEVDMAFLCIGIKSNSVFMDKNFSHVLNEKKQIKVNSHCQIEGHSHIFVAGDISAINEEKTAQNAENQAKIVVNNVYAMEKKIRLYEYVPKNRPMVISLGKHTGIFSYGNFVFTGWIPAILKSLIEFKTMVRYR